MYMIEPAISNWPLALSKKLAIPLPLFAIDSLQGIVLLWFDFGQSCQQLLGATAKIPAPQGEW